MAMDGPIIADDQKPPLRIKVLGGRGFRKADMGPFKGDPFCVVEVSGQRWQTPVAKNTLEPVWNFEIDTTEYELGDWLHFTVWDRDHVTKDDLLGKCAVSCAQWGYPGGFRGDLALKDPSGHGAGPTLTVEIGPLMRCPFRGSTKRASTTDAEEANDECPPSTATPDSAISSRQDIINFEDDPGPEAAQALMTGAAPPRKAWSLSQICVCCAPAIK